MSKEKEIYKVHEGVVTKATPNTEVDWVNSALVIAKTPKEAREIAGRYDRGEIDFDNHVFRGNTVVAIDNRMEYERCPRGEHWVHGYTRPINNYERKGKWIMGHCAKDPKGRR